MLTCNVHTSLSCLTRITHQQVDNAIYFTYIIINTLDITCFRGCSNISWRSKGKGDNQLSLKCCMLILPRHLPESTNFSISCQLVFIHYYLSHQTYISMAFQTISHILWKNSSLFYFFIWMKIQMLPDRFGSTMYTFDYKIACGNTINTFISLVLQEKIPQENQIVELFSCT